MNQQVIISIPQPLLDYLKEQVRLGHAASADEYVVRIISQDQASRNWRTVRSLEEHLAENSD